MNLSLSGRIVLSASLPFLLLFAYSCRTPSTVDYLYVEAIQPIMPVLAGKERNPTLIISLTPRSNYQGQSVQALNVSLAGTTNLSDIEKAQVLYAPNGKFSEATELATVTSIKPELSMQFTPVAASEEGKLWFSLQLVDQPNLSGTVHAKLTSVVLNSGTRVRAQMTENSQPQRTGIALRQAGEDGVNTYRIPGLATTNRGTLLGVYDVRHEASSDLQGNIDVGLSRSTDGGQSWEPMKIIVDMKRFGGRPEDQNGIGDPAILVDRTTNTIWVAALWMHGYPGKRAWTASEPGISPRKTGQFMLAQSDDDGRTWSKPKNVTPYLKDPKWQLFFNGPGKGITMSDGTLVFAAQYKDEQGIPYATIIYSTDGGEFWQVGTGAKSATTEAQVVELSDGGLMLNMRDDRNHPNHKDEQNGRSVYISHDLGETWREHPSSRQALPEPNCMASLISYDHPERGKILFFSNPDDANSRTHLTVKTSFDEGLTWPVDNQLELYAPGTFGYSCLTLVDDDHIGILYEGIGELYFQKIKINELLDRK